MLASSFDSDEDHFRQRLDSINKEMQAIIDRTAMQRDKIFRSGAMASTPWSIVDGPFMEITDSIYMPHNSSSTINTINTTGAAAVIQTTLDEAAVKRIVADEINKWKSKFQESISDTVGNVNTNLERRFETVQKSQIELAESLKEVVETSQRSVKEVQTVLTQMQRSSGRNVEDLTRELDKHMKKSTLEQTRLCDAVAALENESRIDQQRGDRRVDELVRRHHDLVRNSLLELDAHVDSLRDELQSSLRVQARQAAEERDILHQQVARVQGALEATNDTVTRWVTELRTLVEENITRRSEVRSCRRDFNRLEMLLQCVPITGGGGGSGSNDNGGIRVSGEKGNLTQGEGKITSNVGGISREEFTALKEKVDFLTRSMQKTEQQIIKMDGALRNLFARDNGAGSVSHLSQHSHSGMVESNGGGYRPTPLEARNFHDTMHPLLSQDISPNSTGSQQKQMRMMMMQNRSSLGPGIMGRARAGVSPLSFSSPSPVSASSRMANVASYDPRREQHHQYQHHQYHQQHRHHYHHHHHQQQQQHRGSLVSAQSRSRRDSGDMGRPADLSGPASQSFTHHTENVLQSQQRVVPNMLEAAAPECTTERPTPLKTDSDVTSHESTASDSYVSDGDINEQGEDRSMQYDPAPSSDVESELENQKMARLALD
ncbi:hypothetical protein LSM04_004961 [Trypanosoma melophagium]|uniref:uncharacterized protein n=1 Tax=Trypanosoma melophagium TaxID=715481 RepID=UPI00351A6D41|nr:hypothetical protein LSM04_004961 [Trypanosoma melophagium]